MCIIKWTKSQCVSDPVLKGAIEGYSKTGKPKVTRDLDVTMVIFYITPMIDCVYEHLAKELMDGKRQ